MSSQSQITAALGRSFDLALLYDRRSEKLILGKTLSSPDHPSQVVETITKSVPTQVLAEDTIADKTSAVNVEGSLELCLLRSS